MTFSQSGASFFIVAILYYVPMQCETVDFSSIPTTVKTHENSTVLLPCYLDTTNNDGAYALRIKWYKDDVLWADSGLPGHLPPDRFKLWGNGSLEAVDIQPSDTGEYTCEVLRPEPWSPVRQVHAIEVLHQPSVTPKPQSGFLRVRLGEDVTIGCETQGVPAPIVAWTHNGEPLELINNRNVLHFNASDKHLAGVYECIAMNGVGEPARSKIQLQVLYPPEVTTTRLWFHTAPGLRVQLECNVLADPYASVTWYKGEKPIKTDSRILALKEGTKHLLVIRKVQRSDFGFYSCKASNDVGDAAREFQLSGVPNPGVFKITEDKNDSGKDSYTFIWEVDSYTSIIEYTLRFRPYKSTNTLYRPEWTNLTIPTEHKTNSGPVYSKKYTIRGLKEKTVYEVQILSRNRYGWSKPSPTLRFATEGGELTEEVITPPITEPDNSIDDITPMEIVSSTPSLVRCPLYVMLCVGFYLLYI